MKLKDSLKTVLTWLKGLIDRGYLAAYNWLNKTPVVLIALFLSGCSTPAWRVCYDECRAESVKPGPKLSRVYRRGLIPVRQAPKSRCMERCAK